ncbi:hypothetical protein FOA52_000051 [Chlamydomonas sp. UWO 241]|nr:hypothetical protein FOA52_000051 [Chlamydomonas sp. UWO 241]
MDGITEDMLALGDDKELTNRIRGLTLNTAKGLAGTALSSGGGACGSGGATLPDTLNEHESSGDERGEARMPYAPAPVLASVSTAASAEAPEAPASAPAPAFVPAAATPPLAARLNPSWLAVDLKIVAAVLTFLSRHGPTSEADMGRALQHPRGVHYALLACKLQCFSGEKMVFRREGNVDAGSAIEGKRIVLYGLTPAGKAAVAAL